jgi:hypothetical protein
MAAAAFRHVVAVDVTVGRVLCRWVAPGEYVALAPVAGDDAERVADVV